MTGAVLFDFSAAFDVIDHNLLIGKLECYGFSPTAIDFMNSYLTCRKQWVYYTGSWSHSKVLDCGVPQGSCLGPLLYAIFTNDLPSVLCKATVQMYADDSTLYYAAKTVSELGYVLPAELNMVSDWIKQNKLVLNISKTKSVILVSSHKLSLIPKMSLNLSGEPIEQVDKVKLLGTIVDSKLSWVEHIDIIVKKMGSGISMVMKCLSYVPTHILEQVAKS